MSGYAPNPSSQNTGPASLTAGLLARKGEAMPAVDPDAHAGVDVKMYAMRPARSEAHGVGDEAIENLYASNQEPAGAGEGARHVQAAGAAPGAGLAPPRVKPGVRERLLARIKRAEVEGGRKATVTFRMPAKDFVRLRFASHDLSMPCQSILLDAVDTYLDANDVPRVSDEMCARETARLMRSKKPQQS